MNIILIALISLISGLSMAEPVSTPPKGMSQDEWNRHLEFDRKFELKRKTRFKSELKNNPPEPPWVKYPEYPQIDLFWRMGTGEAYVMEYVHPYLNYSSEDALREYKKKYPEPAGWKGWYDE